MSLFKRTNNLSGENTSTEILVYFLEVGNNFIPFQKLFLQKICGKPLSSGQLNLEIYTQLLFVEGRPDIILITNYSIVFIENKLGSYLSGNDQLIKYAKILADLESHHEVFKQSSIFDINKIENKYLVLIAPQNIILASERSTNEIVAMECDLSFQKYCADRNIIFETISWEDILQDLDLSNSLQNELYLYVKDYINQGLTMEDKSILTNDKFPVALDKLFNLMFSIRDSVDVQSFKVGRMSQSYKYFGFTIEHQSLSLYFGYFLPLWSQFRTPIFLQIREAYIKNNNDLILKFIQESNFIRDSNHEYILPFKIEECENWVSELNRVLEGLTSYL